MLLDVQNLVSDDQDLSQTAASYLSDYSIDLAAAGTATGPGGTVRRDPGGTPVQLLCQVTQTFDSGGAATVVVDLVTADNAALTTNLVVIQSTQAIGYATLVAGYEFTIGGTIPRGLTADRYLGLRYTIAGATTTAGTVTAGLVWTK